ncbi:alpha/beta-hydrolase [Penicillium lagena]|uniref:alpha/beta-hydrolase n=1 Tax=Penicillium lagena TaxID=94218 RepID=UPI0025424FB5|nr:alpha/beta-hydrolase [Penicillium lagena]KAJ5604444.1 alpha/beta-hydrolase [Penicillium lagena]
MRQPILAGDVTNENGLETIIALPSNYFMERLFLLLIANWMCGESHRISSCGTRNQRVAVYVCCDVAQSGRRGAGAWHGSEIAQIFGTTEFLTHIPDTQEEAAFGEMMRDIWTTFAKDPWNGLVRKGLPVYNPECAYI